MNKISSAIICGFLIALFFLFWKLDSVPVAEWDEARYGANAAEMLKDHDFVNYHFKNKIDIWNAKPPLQIWLIAGAIQVFGANEFSLRFPSAVAGFLSLAVLFFMGVLLGDQRLGLCFLLLATLNRGLIGYHVARSGDMDAFFVLGLALYSYYLMQIWLSKDFKNNLWWGVFAGVALAFLAKGFAFLLVVPGTLFIFRKYLKQILSSSYFWRGFALFLAVVMGWFSIVLLYGQKGVTSPYGSNSVVVMVFYDIFNRFFGGLSVKEDYDFFSVFSYLDTRFAALYYAAILMPLIIYINRKKISTDATEFFKNTQVKKEAFYFNGVMAFSFLIILTISRNKNNWYIAPLVIWMPALICTWLDTLWSSGSAVLKKTAQVILTLSLAINFYHLTHSILAADARVNFIKNFITQNKEAIANAKTISLDTELRQDEYLYLLWNTQAQIKDILLDPITGIPHRNHYKLSCIDKDCKIDVFE